MKEIAQTIFIAGAIWALFTLVMREDAPKPLTPEQAAATCDKDCQADIEAEEAWRRGPPGPDR